MVHLFNRFKLLVYILKPLPNKFLRFWSQKSHIKNETVSPSILKLKNKLNVNNFVYTEGYTCIHLECKFCDSTENFKNLCYFNKVTGIFICPHCDVSLTLDDAWKAYESGNLLSCKDAPYISRFSDRTEVPETVLPLVGIRNLQQNDLKTIGAEYVLGTSFLWFPLKNSANKIVGEKVFHLIEKTENTFQQSFSGLLMTESKYINKAILVNNILDYIVLCLEKFQSYSIICMPYAFKNIPQECLPALEKFDELIFWFKYDVSSWDSITSFSSKMGQHRCLLIRPTAISPSPYEVLQKNLNFNQILKTSSPVCHKSIITFSSLKNDVFSELQNIEKVRGVQWNRFPILNQILKGHRRGELSIITGPTGSGKTTFIAEYSLDLASQGVSTLWGSFEVRNTRLASVLLRQFAGYSLEDKLHEFNYWANEFEKLPMYFMTFHGQQHLNVIMEAVEHAHYVYDINHIIIDNLQFMMGLEKRRNDKYYEQDSIITAFRSFASNKNIHVTLIIHPRKERPEDDLTISSFFGSAKAVQEADNVLIIQDKRLTSLKGKKFLQVVKNRYSGDLGIMPMDFDKESLSFAIINKKVKDI